MNEKRTSLRVEPVDDCYVVHARLIGSIKNISMDGLYCSCFQECDCEVEEHKKIDILCGQGNFIVRDVPIKIIEIQTIDGKFLQNFHLKKCRMQFSELHPEQAYGIESIVAGACIQ